MSPEPYNGWDFDIYPFDGSQILRAQKTFSDGRTCKCECRVPESKSVDEATASMRAVMIRDHLAPTDEHLASH